jgi:outer membrane murein-binding lipoprotein Lpp
MKINMFSKFFTTSLILAGGFSAVMLAGVANADAQDMRKRPSLVITNDSLPPNTAPTGSVYNAGSSQSAATGNLYTSRNSNRPTSITPMAGEISPASISGSAYYQPTETIVGRKVNELRSDLSSLQSRVNSLSTQLKTMQDNGHALAAEYNASVATINTQLQAGTTPGNPRLVERLNVAQRNLDRMSESLANLNGMAVDAANAASMGSFLLESVRSAFGVSGAVEEDHAALADLEDQINNTIVTIDRVLNNVNDDITRTSGYLSAERNNLRTISLAVTNGDYYGRSLANRPFSSAPPSSVHQASLSPSSGMASDSAYPIPAAYPSPASQGALPSPRPLVKIKFDRPKVNYEQAVYNAVSEAQQKFPNARLEVIAVHPSQGNAAQVAIESTRARRNAELVLRSLTQMGVNVSDVALTTSESAEARSNEVHIFIR